MFRFSNNSKQRLLGINPLLAEVMNEALSLSPIDFGIPADGGLRSANRQHQLYTNFKSKCDGYNKKSAHQSGNAVDVFAYVNGRVSWDPIHLSIIAGTILAVAKRKGLSLIWGGRFGSDSFKGWDLPHFEIRKKP